MGLIQYARANQGVSSSNLPFFMRDIKGSPPIILQNNKDTILSDFLKGFKAINSNVPELRSMTKTQLQQLLSQWNSASPGSLGEELGNNLANYLDKEIITGAGIAASFANAIETEGINNIEDAAAQSIEAAQQALNIIMSRLATYINILKQVDEPALLMKIIELHNSCKTPVTDMDLVPYNGTKLSEVELARISSKVSSNFQKLQEVIDTLQALSQGKGTIGKHPVEQVENLLSTAAKCFNPVGGEGIHEIIGEHAANLVKVKGEQEVVQATKSLFQQSGGKVSAHSNLGANTGIGKMQGKQLKPDIEITWDLNGVLINLPVSMKARQSTSNYNINTGRTKGTIQPQGIQLGELLAMTLKSTASTKWYEQGLAAVLYAPNASEGDLANSYQPFIQSWKEFTEAAKYVALFRALVGTGMAGDFAALFIVNNTVFSIYDILNKADNSSIVRWGTGWTGGNLGVPDFSYMISQVSGKYRDGINEIPDETNKRISEEQGWIETLWNRKIYIEIQLSNLIAGL